MTTTTPGSASVAYVVFEVSDLVAWDRFLTRFVGAVVAEPIGGASRYRIDAAETRIVLREGARDDLDAFGFALPDARALEAAASCAAAEGSSVVDLDPEALAIRGVEGGVRTHDPAGNPIELAYGSRLAADPFRSALAPSGFVTGELGLGHAALRADDVAASRRWYERVLGARLSDKVECELPGGIDVDLTFLHVNRRHHSLALGRGLPKRINHFMLELPSLDDVGALADRARAARVPIALGLGRHPNDRMVSFYCVTPSGFELELGTGGRTIDDEARWMPRVYDRISEWGHARPARERSAR